LVSLGDKLGINGGAEDRAPLGVKVDINEGPEDGFNNH
jgi:hypothetical protein